MNTIKNNKVKPIVTNRRQIVVSRNTYDELLPIVKQQWAGVKDIQIIAEVGPGKARNIFTSIKNQIRNEGKLVLKSHVPMERVLNFLNIDINRILRFGEEKNNENTRNTRK